MKQICIFVEENQIMKRKYCSEINVPTNVFMRHQFVKCARGEIEQTLGKCVFFLSFQHQARIFI